MSHWWQFLFEVHVCQFVGVVVVGVVGVAITSVATLALLLPVPGDLLYSSRHR
jgi:hypothetical protein